MRAPRHLRPVHTIEEDDRHAVLETPDHEVIELEGCSEDEVQRFKTSNKKARIRTRRKK
jgi:hypothetical protein